MKRFQGLLNRSKSISHGKRNGLSDTSAPIDSPEANAPRAIRLFCESGSATNGGEEVLQLPVIVEAAESSPAAAAGAAQQIRKFLSKEWQSKPHVQYNAIMLIRILSDNPGPSFTRNFDKPFILAVKETLRSCKDPSTVQILRETLDYIEAEKQFDDETANLIQMWRKEKGYQAAINQARRAPMMPNQASYSQGYMYPPQQNQRSSSRTRLPPPGELASRVEESRNTAKILLQLISSTPADEVINNDLLKEFNERCQAASRSMQTYINSENPAPDHDTMQTLIETNEQLSVAASRYQRAMLAARRATSMPHNSNPEPSYNGNHRYNGSSVSGGASGFHNGNNYLAVSAPQEFRAVSPPESFRTSSPPHDSRTASPPQIPTTRINGFEGHGSYTPPPDRLPYQGYNPDGYQQQSNSQPTNLFAAVDQSRNPFADPINYRESVQPTFNNSGSNISHFRTMPTSAPAPVAPPHLREPSQTFAIEPEPTYGPSGPPQNPGALSAFIPTPPSFARHTTSELENVYATTTVDQQQQQPSTRSPLSSGHPSPLLARVNPNNPASTSSPRLDSDSAYTVSPAASPPRPTHAAPVRTPATHPHDHAAEVDGNSTVAVLNRRGERESIASSRGRRDTVSSFGSPDMGSSPTFGSDANAMYVVSPIENRVAAAHLAQQQQQQQQQQAAGRFSGGGGGGGGRRSSRVDVLGTGGLRGFNG